MLFLQFPGFSPPLDGFGGRGTEGRGREGRGVAGGRGDITCLGEAWGVLMLYEMRG